jgi:RHS repeat-associated protein
VCSTSQDPCQSIVPGTQRLVDDYGYDANDNRTSVAEDNGSGAVTTTYGYDGRNQLIADSSVASPACNDGTGTLYAYAYDAAGNRTCAANRTFGYVNGTGQLESCTGTACAPVFDADGRLTRITVGTNTTWSYLYDGEGRLVSACAATSCTGTGLARLDSVYDGEGHRIRLVETPAGQNPVPTITDFTYEGDKVVREVATTGTTVRTRTFTVDEAGAIVKMVLATTGGSTDDGTYLVTWNGHGDAVELSRIDLGTGLLTPANRFTYSTWGTPVLQTVGTFGDLGFRYRYVGRFDVQWDSTPAVPAELLYMHARHYSPEIGRFLQPDPSAAEANLYGYASNSAVSNTDPSGLRPSGPNYWRELFIAHHKVSWFDWMLVASSGWGWCNAMSLFTRVFMSGWACMILFGISRGADLENQVQVDDVDYVKIRWNVQTDRVMTVFWTVRNGRVVKMRSALMWGGKRCAQELRDYMSGGWFTPDSCSS